MQVMLHETWHRHYCLLITRRPGCHSNIVSFPSADDAKTRRSGFIMFPAVTQLAASLRRALFSGTPTVRERKFAQIMLSHKHSPSVCHNISPTRALARLISTRMAKSLTWTLLLIEWRIAPIIAKIHSQRVSHHRVGHLGADPHARGVVTSRPDLLPGSAHHLGKSHDSLINARCRSLTTPGFRVVVPATSVLDSELWTPRFRYQKFAKTVEIEDLTGP